MAELSDSDRDEAQRLAAVAMAGEGPAVAEAALEGVGIDPKALFCEHWDELKPIIQFLGDKVGGVAKIGAKAIIAAGDFLHGRICP